VIDMHDLLDDLLDATIAVITGDATATPRPGQKALAHAVLTAMMGRDLTPGKTLGCAPTGVGKAVGVCVPAAVMAAELGHRTIVSTESLALQAQLLGKDLPDVAEAVARVFDGAELRFAVLKGWSNHGCPRAAIGALEDETGRPFEADNESDVKAAAKAAATISSPVGRLISWVLDETVNAGTADRSDYTGDVSEWGQVSVSPSECAKRDCPLYDYCPAVNARQKVSEAHIVVTNHAMLSVQAATGVSVVLSNRSVGPIDHLVIDEAHALPPAVRNAGAKTLSGRAVSRVARLIGAKFGSVGSVRVPEVDAVVDDGYALAGLVDKTVSEWLRGQGPSGTATMADEDNPVTDLASGIATWITAAKAVIPNIGTVVGDMHRRRALSALGELSGIVDDLISPGPGHARWGEWGLLADTEKVRGWRGGAARVSPVDVSFAIAANLYHREEPQDDDMPPVDVPISVSMVSATMPASFGSEVGIGQTVTEYPSPFAAAYAASAFYSPALRDGTELSKVARLNGPRWKFDVDLHQQWAIGQIIALVTANGGAALVLSATKRGGQAYAEALRAKTDFTVHSQWDGQDVARVAAEWIADHDSVLVGTRSLMTGLDAAGQTCSLVIVDRALRAPANVVDDARCASAAARFGLDRWAADRHIYVGDAATKMEQAAGRLIRRVTDSGMIAVLDPRLARQTPLTYPEATRNLYMTAVRYFPNKTAEPEQAIAWLTAARAIRHADAIGTTR
jgi:ATP-dependent DNA helicase DinG